ncbi:MAG: restriction endonuclease subunit S, partial [Bacteroidaceae bacterium]|nr:restriction endonuclease subunit S [Bacteroidaceae bacterium]
MSKIDELIKELCPNGVEYVPIWKLTAWDKKYLGVDKSKQSKIISYKYLLAKDLFALEMPEGDVKLLSTGTQEGWTTEDIAGDYLYEGEIVSIPWGKSVEAKEPVKYYKGKFVTGDNRIACSLNDKILKNKYLYYWLHANTDKLNALYRGASIQHPCMNDVLNLEIPLPPLPIQEEI